ncbi:MAG: site-2 protease family protein [Spiroplasmataceae bacterium]|jgi:hypothetical protein|nr:site-2 protease family protein [Spiroplasmataceae bacterium]
MEDGGKILGILLFFLILFVCYYSAKKNDRRKYSWKDISWIIIFSYLWNFLNIFVHECGHALTALAFGGAFYRINIGVGWELLSFWKRKLIFHILPIGGVVEGIRAVNMTQGIFVLAMGVITQFIFLGLVYWLLKRNKNWQKTLIGHFTYNYAIKIAFWITFVFNCIPFVHPESDWTKITKIILGWN